MWCYVDKVRLIIGDEMGIVRCAVSGIALGRCHGVDIVAQAKDYGELMRALAQMPCDIVVMDLNMPSEV